MEIIAHRGSREGTAEHTLAAYRRAILDGADALECDIRFTADKHLVCLHDRRLDFVSNSRGVVSEMNLAALRQVHFGARRPWRLLDARRGGPLPEQHVCADPADHTAMTLRQLLELTTATPRLVGLAIETKHPTRYGGQIETTLVELLDEFGLRAHGRAQPAGDAGAQRGTPPRVRVMSFAVSSLRRMRRLAPDLDLVLLLGRVPVHLRDGRLPEGVRAAGIDVTIVRKHPQYVAKLHEAGNAVYVWTVNTAAEADRCLAAGVDALITDRPSMMRAHVRGGRAANTG